MPEFTYPGVYNEERGRRLAPVQGVSTSNFGVVGMAERGPEDVATLSVSFAQFQEKFGDFITDSILATQVYAFFANEGRRTYVVRVCRSDAARSTGKLENDIDRELMLTGDGVKIAYDSVIGPEPDLQNPEVKPGSLSIIYDQNLPPVVAEVLYVAPPIVPLSHVFQTVRFPIIRPAVATLLLSWMSGAVPVTARIVGAATDDILTIVSVGTGLPMGFIDMEKGLIVADFALEPIDPVTNVTADYIPMDRKTITDDGAGILVGDVAPGNNRVDYAGTQLWSNFTPGAVQFQCLAAAFMSLGSKVRATYVQYMADIQASWRGAAGNSITTKLKGSEGSYDRDLGSYASFDVETWYNDPMEGANVLKETFTGLVFDDATDPNDFMSVINDAYKGSDWFDVVSVTNDDPGGLQGIRVEDEVIGGGDGAITSIGPVFILRPGIEPWTVSIEFTSGGVVHTLTDDGSGNLGDGGTGILDTLATNVVDYTLGVVQFTLAAGNFFDRLTFVTIGYSLVPMDGDDEIYTMTGGSDGVNPLSRAQISSPTLEAQNKGLYALNVPDEMMQVGVPDFAGDVVIAGDQLDWAARVKDKFIILTTPYGLTPQQAKDYKRFTLNRNDTYGALYYPWVGLIDPITDTETFQPAIGHLAGVIARTDTSKNVSKAPAGVDDGRLAFTTSLEYNMALEEIGTLNPIGVNSLYESEYTGRVVWGARTLGVNTEFRYIQARRLFMFVEKSVYKSMWGFVFDTISNMLFQRVTNATEGFLSGLLSLGYFPTGTPGQAYALVCNSSNNSAATLASGLVICDVYLATSTPGEFLLFRYQQLVTT